MTHAPRFWADKLPDDSRVRADFWALVDIGYGGETAYCRTVSMLTIEIDPSEDI